jgi:beta-lactamase class A
MTKLLLKSGAVLVLVFAAANASAQTNEVGQTFLSVRVQGQAGMPVLQASALDQRVRAEVAQFKGKVNLFAKNLDTGVVYELGGDDRVPTASTIKIAIMIEAFSRVAEGKAKWTDELALTKEKKVAGATPSTNGSTCSASKKRA